MPSTTTPYLATVSRGNPILTWNGAYTHYVRKLMIAGGLGARDYRTPCGMELNRDEDNPRFTMHVFGAVKIDCPDCAEWLYSYYDRTDTAT